MSSSHQCVWRNLLAAGVGLTLVGCISPTLPLPPPEGAHETAIDLAKGTVTIAGGPGSVHGGALVYGYNARLGEGVFTKASAAGAFLLEAPAQVGDAISLWEEYEMERSEPAVIVIRPSP